MVHLCYLYLVFVMLSHLFIAALWSPAGKGLTSRLLFVMSYCDFVTFPCGILGQVWCLIVLILDLCRLSYFVHVTPRSQVQTVCKHYQQEVYIVVSCLIFCYTYASFLCLFV